MNSRIRRRRGPWEHKQTLTYGGDVHCDIVRTPGEATLAFNGDGGDADFYEHDARFIAESRSVLPALLDEVDLLTKHEAHINEEYQVMKDMLRAEHEECKRLRAGILRACDGWESLWRSEMETTSNPNPPEEIASLRKLAGGTP